jgi:hypothetical protein
MHSILIQKEELVKLVVTWLKKAELLEVEAGPASNKLK